MRKLKQKLIYASQSVQQMIMLLILQNLSTQTYFNVPYFDNINNKQNHPNKTKVNLCYLGQK